jgi:hypothetical protein
MALKQSNQIKLLSGTGDLTLTADPGESFLVKDIYIYNPATNYLTVKVERKTVGYFRIGGSLGNQLAIPTGMANLLNHPAHTHNNTFASAALQGTDLDGVKADHAQSARHTLTNAQVAAMPHYPSQLPNSRIKTILGLLAEKGIFKGYPVATGESIILEGAGQAGAIQAILYDIYDEEDIKRDQENGSMAKEYFLINYGDTGDAISSSGDHLFDNCLSPAELPDFPFGDVVPSRTEIDMLGILASDVAPAGNDGTNYVLTQYLKLMVEREILFDEDRNGLPLMALHSTNPISTDLIGMGFSLSGNYSSADARLPLFLDPPLTFKSGDEVKVFLNCLAAGSGVSLSTALQQISFILKVRRTE